MIKKFVSRCFAARNLAHIAHWNATSYAQHIALGDFYESIIDLIDKYVETYQGNSGLIGKIDLEECDCEILECIEETTVWIEKSYAELSDGLTSLENILDSILELFLTTRYKLKHLK